jgi:hypothetical protein
MPFAASIIDEWREVFGVEWVNALIKAGMAGQPNMFHVKESGIELGTPFDVGLECPIFGPDRRERAGKAGRQ